MHHDPSRAGKFDLTTSWYWAISSAEGIQTFAESSSLNTLNRSLIENFKNIHSTE
jgi:hypothetical protein